MKKFLFPLLIILFSCTSSPESDEIPINTTVVENAEQLISPESNPNIAMPSGLLSDGDRLLVYDSGAVTMFVYDKDGNLQFSFGSEGDGPGEFRFVPEFWTFNDTYLLYDRNSAKMIRFSLDGEYMTDYAIDAGSMSLSLAAKSPRKFYLPTLGQHDALIEFTDLDSEESGFMFGESVTTPPEGLDMQQAQRQAISGRVPAFMQNQIILSANRSGVYSFQQTSALLQKFSHNGEMEWELDLEIPATEGIFDQFVERNKMMSDRGQGNLIMLQYAADIEATEDGVAILLNTLETYPVTVAWISNNGSEIEEIQFPGLDSFEARPRSFTLSDSGDSIYFTAAMDGSVYRADWPL